MLEEIAKTPNANKRVFPRFNKKLKTPRNIREKYKAKYLKVSPIVTLSSICNLLCMTIIENKKGRMISGIVNKETPLKAKSINSMDAESKAKKKPKTHEERI